MDVVAGATNAGAGPRQRCRFLVLWLRFIIVFWILAFVFGYLRYGKVGLVYAAAACVVIVPIKALIWAGLVRMVQKVFSPRTATIPAQAGKPPARHVPETPLPPNFSQKDSEETDADLYAAVGAEVRLDQLQDAAWARALAEEPDGDPNKVKSRYVRLRVSQLRAERQDAGATEVRPQLIATPSTAAVETSTSTKEASNAFTFVAVVILVLVFAIGTTLFLYSDSGRGRTTLSGSVGGDAKDGSPMKKSAALPTERPEAVGMETHSSGDAEEITWRAADLNLSGRTRLIVPARASTKQIIKLLDESFPLTPEWIQRSKADSTDNDPRVKGFPKDLLAHKNPMEYWTKNERLTVGGEHYLAKQKPSGCSELRLTVHQGFVETKDWRSEELFKELEAAPNLFYVRYGMADNKPEVVAIIRQQRFDSWCEAEAYIAVGNVIKDLRELEAATIENQDVVRKVAEFIDGTAP